MATASDLEVCLTPELLHLHTLPERVVVVVDIFRATSCMVTGLATGVPHIVPHADLEACRAYREKGYLIAAERGGQQVEGFDMGNSPYGYMEAGSAGKPVAMTTTNGTRALEASKGARQVLIGAFLNLGRVAEYLVAEGHPVLIVCAGWKGRYSLEDTLFAGAMAHALLPHFACNDDAALAAVQLWEQHGQNAEEFLTQSAHYKRLEKMGIRKDLTFCVQQNRYDVLPILKNGQLHLL